MSFDQLLLTMIIFLVIIFSIDFYLVKVLKIKRPRKTPFDKERKKLFTVSEIILIIGFIVSFFVIAAISSNAINVSNMLFLYISVLYLMRGIEDYMYNKDAKGYYHEWSGSFCFLCMFILFILMK